MGIAEIHWEHGKDLDPSEYQGKVLGTNEYLEKT